MNQTIDSTVTQATYLGKSSGLFSWGAFMATLAFMCAGLFYMGPVAPYAGSVFPAAETQEACCADEPVFVEDLTSIERAMHTLEDVQMRQKAMRQFQDVQNTPLTERDLVELKQVMKTAGFSEAYTADFLARKRTELAVREGEDTTEFAKSIAKEIVQEEVNSIAHRIDLLTRVGGFVLKKAQSSSAP